MLNDNQSSIVNIVIGTLYVDSSNKGYAVYRPVS